MSQSHFRCKNFIRVLNQIKKLFFNQFIVTFLTDIIVSYLVFYQVQSKLRTKEQLLMQMSDFAVKYEYLMLEFATAVGMFIARSNANVMIVERPISMSVLQAINFIFTVLNITVFNITDFSFMFFYMIYVGFIGGSIYINTFCIITQKNKKETHLEALAVDPVAFEDQEIALNLCLIGMDLGYSCSALFGLVLS